MSNLAPLREFGLWVTAVAALLSVANCRYFSPAPDSGPVLASVGEQTLHTSDVGDLVPVGTPPEDSIRLLREYVDALGAGGGGTQSGRGHDRARCRPGAPRRELPLESATPPTGGARDCRRCRYVDFAGRAPEGVRPNGGEFGSAPPDRTGFAAQNSERSPARGGSAMRRGGRTATRSLPRRCARQVTA